MVGSAGEESEAGVEGLSEAGWAAGIGETGPGSDGGIASERGAPSVGAVLSEVSVAGPLLASIAGGFTVSEVEVSWPGSTTGAGGTVELGVVSEVTVASPVLASMA